MCIRDRRRTDRTSGRTGSDPKGISAVSYTHLMLASMGEYFDTQEEIAARKLAAGLEPALMVVLAIATGFIVISMYLPLLSMYGQM